MNATTCPINCPECRRGRTCTLAPPEVCLTNTASPLPLNGLRPLLSPRLPSPLSAQVSSAHLETPANYPEEDFMTRIKWAVASALAQCEEDANKGSKEALKSFGDQETGENKRSTRSKLTPCQADMKEDWEESPHSMSSTSPVKNRRVKGLAESVSVPETTKRILHAVDTKEQKQVKRNCEQRRANGRKQTTLDGTRRTNGQVARDESRSAAGRARIDEWQTPKRPSKGGFIPEPGKRIIQAVDSRDSTYASLVAPASSLSPYSKPLSKRREKQETSLERQSRKQAEEPMGQYNLKPPTTPDKETTLAMDTSDGDYAADCDFSGSTTPSLSPDSKPLQHRPEDQAALAQRHIIKRELGKYNLKPPVKPTTQPMDLDNSNEDAADVLADFVMNSSSSSTTSSSSPCDRALRCQRPQRVDSAEEREMTDQKGVN